MLCHTDLNLYPALPLVGCMRVGKQLNPNILHQHHEGALLLQMEKLSLNGIKHFA